MPLARRAQDVGAPHEHVARPVVWVVWVLAAHGQAAILERLDDVVLRVHARRSSVLGHLHGVGLELGSGRQPAHALGAHVVVDLGAVVGAGVGQRRKDFFHAQLFVAPLVGVRVEEAGAVHLAGWTDPVQRKRQGSPAGLGAQLFLAHIVRPATTALANTAAQHQHVDDAAVVHVTVVPVVHGRADDDHGLAMRLVGVVGKLAGHGDDLLARHTGDLFLPCGGEGAVGVVAAAGLFTGQATVDAVVGCQQVEHRGHHHAALHFMAVQLQMAHGHAAHHHVTALVVGGEVGGVHAAKVREGHVSHVVGLLAVFDHRQLELDGVARAGILVLQVPQALVGAAVRTPTEADGAVGQRDLAQLVIAHGLPVGVVRLVELVGEVAGAHVAVRHHGLAAVGQRLFLEHHQQWQVGVAAGVVVKVAAPPLATVLEVELFQDHMAHGHGHGRIGALLGVHPQVTQLGHFGIVGRDGHDFGALVAHLSQEVRVGRARLGHVGAPGNDVRAVVPVGRLGHVGLLAPGLWAAGGQVAIPVVEAHAHAANQAQVARTGCVRNHRHRRDGREADDAVGAMLLDRVHIGCSDHLVDFVPGAAHEAAQAALLLPVTARSAVLDDAGPGVHRALGQGNGSAPVLEQAATHHGVLHAVGAVQVPAVAGAACAATGFVVGQVGAGAGVVGLLGFPGDDAALDVDLPRARARAVHTVGGAHDLVVRPAVAVGVFPGAVFTVGFAVALCKCLAGLREVREAIEKMAHRGLLVLSVLCGSVGRLSKASRRSCGRSTTR